MGDDVLKSLQTYIVQLEQVEAALLSDPNNEELKKLQSDLQEVISLTKNLPEPLDPTDEDYEDESESFGKIINIQKWKVSDKCCAQWSEDGKWYNAQIDAITEDGMVAVTFEGFGSSGVTKLSLLRDPKLEMGAGHSAENEKARKSVSEQMRIISKKKKQKKFDRQKMIEEAHEADKAKWQAFTHKVGKSKKLKGLTKKSIFATPEAANGRVGIGTCGIGGKPMTTFTHAEKWRKGT